MCCVFFIERKKNTNKLYLIFSFFYTNYFIVIKFYLDPTKKSGQRLVGDVDYNEAKNVASVITPVPGMCFFINKCVWSVSY
jgi:hypothetical protein